MARFEKTKPSTDREEATDFTKDWPDDHTICHCTNTDKGTIVSCLEKCSYDPDLVADRTGASSKCGTCLPFVEELCAVTPRSPLRTKNSFILRAASILVFILLGYLVVAYRQSIVQSLNSLWNSDAASQSDNK